MPDAARKLPEDELYQPPVSPSQTAEKQSDNIVNLEEYRRDQEFSRQLKQARLNNKLQNINDNQSLKESLTEELKKPINQFLSGEISSKEDITNALNSSAANIVSNAERQTINTLKQKQEETKNKISKEDLAVIKQLGESAKNIYKRESLFHAAVEGLKIGFKLRSTIKKSEWGFISFIIVLIISLFVDFFDLINAALGESLHLGLIPQLIDWALWIGLVIFFFGKGNYVQRMFVKFFFWVIFVELIPIIDLVPSYTIATILLKLKLDKKVEKNKSDLDKVEKVTEKITKQLPPKDQKKIKSEMKKVF